MAKPNLNADYSWTRGPSSGTVHEDSEKRISSADILQWPHNRQFKRPSLSTSEIAAMEEAKRRWPGIVVMTHRYLDDKLGMGVYFTFPGGKCMAVWMSGTDKVSVASEDEPVWRRFVSSPGAIRAKSPNVREVAFA